MTAVLWSALLLALSVSASVADANVTASANVMVADNGCAAAAGDGTTNDRAAIQCQIDAASAGLRSGGDIGGGQVYLPCGRYLIDGGGVTIRDGVFLVGEAQQCAVLVVTDDETAIQFAMVNNGHAAFGMKELRVDCFQNPSATHDCLWAYGPNAAPHGYLEHLLVFGGRCALHFEQIGDWYVNGITAAGWGAGGASNGKITGNFGCNLWSVNSGITFVRAKLDQNQTTISYAVVEIKNSAVGESGDTFIGSDTVANCVNTNSGGPSNVCVYIDGSGGLSRPQFIATEVDKMWIKTTTATAIVAAQVDGPLAIGGGTVTFSGSYGIGSPVVTGAGRSVCLGTVNMTCKANYN